MSGENAFYPPLVLEMKEGLGVNFIFQNFLFYN